jgi:hypothetical protein
MQYRPLVSITSYRVVKAGRKPTRNGAFAGTPVKGATRAAARYVGLPATIWSLCTVSTHAPVKGVEQHEQHCIEGAIAIDLWDAAAIIRGNGSPF